VESVDPINIKVSWDQIGLETGGEYKVRDLWTKKDLGTFKNGFNHPYYAWAGLFKISK